MNILSRINNSCDIKTTFVNLIGRNCTRVRRYSVTRTRNVTLDYSIIGEETSRDLKPIIICHGLFGNKNNWRSLSKRIQHETGRKVINYDAVNHGNSSHHPDMSYHDQADDLFHLMDLFNVQKALLIGHSMGGKTVMTAALNQPEKIEKLIVVDAAPALSQSSGEVFTYMAHMDQMVMSDMKTRQDVKEDLGKVTKSPFMMDFLMLNLTVDDKNGAFKWRVNLKALIQNYDLIHGFPTLPLQACYDGATQFVGGGRSKYIQESNFAEIYKRFPRANIQHVPDAGHWVHADKPTEFLQVVCEFINAE